MIRAWPRFLILPLLFYGLLLSAEKAADLPIPTRYVNDFAQVLSPSGQQQIEDLCLEIHRQANAELVVVTIKSLDDGQSAEEFSAQLEEKWKIGKKGVDRSALIILILSPHRLRVETGYGLEGILPDARIGRILDTAVPSAEANDYDQALLTITQGLADVIAADAHVTLAPVVHQYHREGAVPQSDMPAWVRIVLGLAVALVILILILTGHIGAALWIILNLISGGRGGGGGSDDEGGGGFGGSGGGESGGGGASRDF